VTVAAGSTAELRRLRDQACDADLIELRLDLVSDPDVQGALAGRNTPVIITCRSRREGGSFRGSEDERKKILREAIVLGAEYVDIEWRSGFDDLIAQAGGRGIVASMHDFDGVPKDLSSQLDAMLSTGASVAKISAQTSSLSDCVSLFEAGNSVDRRGRVVVLGMGDCGVATRILAARFGSAWTYAGGLGEVGQISPTVMLKDFHFRSVTDSTAVYGIVGGSVKHSVSPSMHNAAFRALGVDAVYMPFPAVSAEDFVTFGRAIGVSGASVTIPHKVTLFERLDELYPAARRIGAVNTIRVEGGRWIGDNSDAVGFLEPLKTRLALNGLRASVVGAGGAARAVADALSASHCSVTIHARRQAEAERVAALTSSTVGPWPPAAGSWDLLVNCTPIGQLPNADNTPVPVQNLTGRFVYDLVYNPPTTRLLREAASMGCQRLGGLEMLVAQAHEQFTWWTGTRPPAGLMREAALKRLAEFARDEDHVV
jgi:3-dehydroquinate dehydratase/shikimate dehydrogenase